MSEKLIPRDLCLRLFFALEVTETVCAKKKKKKEIKRAKGNQIAKEIFHQILSRAEHWASYFSRSSVLVTIYELRESRYRGLR